MVEHLELLCEFVAEDHSLRNVSVRRVVKLGEAFRHEGFAGDRPSLVRYGRYRIPAEVMANVLERPGGGVSVTAGSTESITLMMSVHDQTADEVYVRPRMLAFYRSDAFTLEDAVAAHEYREENHPEFDATATFVVLHLDVAPIRALFAPQLDAPKSIGSILPLAVR